MGFIALFRLSSPRNAAWVVIVASITLLIRDMIVSSVRDSSVSTIIHRPQRHPPFNTTELCSSAYTMSAAAEPAPKEPLVLVPISMTTPVKHSQPPPPPPPPPPPQQQQQQQQQQHQQSPAPVPPPTVPTPSFSFSGAPSLSLLAAGRCLLYPRCLLFACCSEAVLTEADRSFELLARADTYACMTDNTPPRCGALPAAPAQARLQGHPLSGVTITRDLLEKGLAALPPTPPSVFAALRTRSSFNVLYLAQGSTPQQHLPPWYSGMKNFLYLSYRNVSADLYFPSSNFGEGRMALYLAGRQLELQQGWLFDYYIFLDDDAKAVSADPHYIFEMDLLQWEPAVAGPSYQEQSFTVVTGTAHMDFIMIAYHREALEVLHPYVIDFDPTCIWASQVLQLYEMNLVFRNHVVFTRDFGIFNGQHSLYPANCFVNGGPSDRGFPGAYATVKSSIDASRARCLPASDVTNRDFRQYIISGIGRPRLASYALARGSTFTETAAVCAANNNFALRDCCSMDSFVPQTPRAPQSPFHNKIIAARSTPSGPFSFVWGASRWEFDGTETIAALGFKTSDVLVVDERELAAVPLLNMRSTHAQLSSLPQGTRVQVAESSLLLIIGADGIAQVPSAAQPANAAAPLLVLMPWRLRYLALSPPAREAAFSAGLLH